MSLIEKYKVPGLVLILFVLIGTSIAIVRGIQYLYLFSGIGLTEFVARIIVINYPQFRQFFRILGQSVVAGILFVWVSIIIGVNFQFPQIFFDISAGVITGALIQIVIARVILPFIFGNAFCSRACWTGLFFELTNKKWKKAKPVKRSGYLAWGYLIFLIVMTVIVSFYWNPAEDLELRRKWIIGENLFIIGSGFILTFFMGSRAYCRLLCPFITISSLFSKYSILKITPAQQSLCTNCNICSTKCPMLIDVRTYVAENRRVDDKMCIVCERCVSGCPENVLRLSGKKIKLSDRIK